MNGSMLNGDSHIEKRCNGIETLSETKDSFSDDKEELQNGSTRSDSKNSFDFSEKSNLSTSLPKSKEISDSLGHQNCASTDKTDATAALTFTEALKSLDLENNEDQPKNIHQTSTKRRSLSVKDEQPNEKKFKSDVSFKS